MLNFLQISSRRGIFIKACPDEGRDRRSLEMLSKVDTVVFDTACVHPLRDPPNPRTLLVSHVGTIYTYTCKGYQEQEVLQYPAAAEYYYAL